MPTTHTISQSDNAIVDGDRPIDLAIGTTNTSESEIIARPHRSN
jgi:hypothetical protein